MNIGPILSKELSLLGRSPGTWVVGAVHLFVQGLIFALLVITMIQQTGRLHPQMVLPTFVWLPLFFVVPAYCMRLFSDEARFHTDELLFTSPVSSMGVVLGKWLAASAVALLPLLVGGVFYAYVMSVWAKVAVAPVLLSFGALMLVTLLFTAVGALTAVMSLNSMVCLFLHFGVLLLLLLLDSLGNMPLGGGGLADTLAQFSLFTHLESFAEGAIELVDLAYFGLAIAGLLFVTARVVDQRRCV